MNHEKKKKCKWRRGMSVMLSAALMFSALPASGAWTADQEVPSAPAAQEEGAGEATPTPLPTFHGVQYEIHQDANGNQYVEVKSLANDFGTYVTEEGEYAFPAEIEGIPVKSLRGVYAGKDFESDDLRDAWARVKKLTLPDTICGWSDCVMVNDNLEKVEIMYLGKLQKMDGTAWSTSSVLSDAFLLDGEDCPTLDIYCYAEAPISSATGYWSALGVSKCDMENRTSTNPKILHVRENSGVGDYLGRMSKFKTAIQDGALVVKEDIVVTPYMELNVAVREAEMLTEANFTKGSWPPFAAALAAAKAIGKDAEDEAVNAAMAALATATEGLVSLVDLKAALASAAEQDRELYIKSTWDALQAAVAAAGGIADDITREDLAAVTKAVTDAIAGLEPLKASTLTVTCADVQAPAKPEPQVAQNDSGGEVTFEYSTSAEFKVPETEPRRGPGTYYVRARTEKTDEYAAATSDPVQFTITAAPAQGEGYSLDEESGVLTITDPALLENLSERGDAPWYSFGQDSVTAVRIRPAEGKSLTKIGAYAFSHPYGWRKLETIELPEGVEEIGDHALRVVSLKAMELPASVKTVGEGAFSGNSEWESAVTLEGITAGKEAFRDCRKLRGTATLAEGMKEIPEGLFWNSSLDSGTEDYPLPAGTERIGKNAFRGTSIRTVAMPDSLKEIGEEAFRDSGLTAISIPEGVTLIGKHFVTGSAKLEYVEFQNTGYTEENLMLSKREYRVYMDTYNVEETFEGLPHTAAVLCDGATHDLLAPCAGYYQINYLGKDLAIGWPASILRRTGEYIGGYAREIQESIDAAKQLEQADYSAEAWQALQAAIGEAEKLLDKGETNYERRKNSSASRDRLAAGIKGCLRSLADSTEAMAGSSQAGEDYDREADSWYDLMDALEDAGKLTAAESPAPEGLLEGIAALKNAVRRLEYLPLEAAIAGAAGKNQGDYTAESWAAYQEAVSQGQAIRKAGTRDEKAAAAEKISQAEKALEKKPEPPATPTAVPTGTPAPSPTAAATQKPGTTQKPGASQTPRPGGTTAGPAGKPAATPTAVPKAPRIKKAAIKKVKSPRKKTLQVQWKKLGGVTGYQVQAALDKKFRKGKKTYAVKKAGTTKKTIRKLKRKKKYYVRVRGYKTVKGKKYYGKWSKAKKAKTK